MQTALNRAVPLETGSSATTDRRLKRTGRLVGVLYVLGTAAGVLSALVLTPLVGAPDDVLSAIAGDRSAALLGAFFIVVMGLALALIPLLVYPILSVQSQPLALGYVVVRGALETAIYLASAAVWLLLVALSRDYSASDTPGSIPLERLSAAALQLNDAVGDVILAIVFALGALIFNYLLFRTGLVPRWISGGGLLAASVWMSAGVLANFGLVDTRSTEQLLMALPVAIQEMVLAGWLMGKGFNTGARGAQ